MGKGGEGEVEEENEKKTSVTEHNLVVGLGLLLKTCWATSGYFYCLTDAKISFEERRNRAAASLADVAHIWVWWW